MRSALFFAFMSMLSAFYLRLKNGGTTFNRSMFWGSAFFTALALFLIDRVDF